jgi:hypothetical protein
MKDSFQSHTIRRWMTRSISHLVLLFVTACSALAQSAWSVDLAPARKRLIPRNELAIYCRSDRDIDGCTEFLAEVLQCDCQRGGADWLMAAHASLVPYMYLTRPRVEDHEQLHFDDLREQIGAYLAELTARHFNDRDSCASVAEFETTVFNLRMNLFFKLSNLRLH